MRAPRAAFIMALCAAMLGGRSAQAQADTAPPAITPQPVAAPTPGQPLVVTCDITDRSGIFAPLVYWRLAGTTQFAQAELKNVGGSHFKATIPLPPGASGVEYYLEAYDSEGNGPTWVGSPTAPLEVAIAAPPVAVAPSHEAASPTNPAAPGPPLVSLRAPAHPSPVLPIALVSAGGVAVICGIVLGATASKNYDSFKTTFDPEERPNLQSSIRGESLGADISFGAGVVAAAAGATLFFLRRPGAPEDSDTQHLVLVPSVNGVFAEGSF